MLIEEGISLTCSNAYWTIGNPQIYIYILLFTLLDDRIENLFDAFTDVFVLIKKKRL